MARIRRKVTKTGTHRKKQKKIVLTDEQRAKRREEDARLAQELKSITHYITTPAGLPPYELEGDDFESIRDWVSKLKTTGAHTVQSCQFWVKYFYDPFNEKDQWRAVRNTIEEKHQDLGLPHFPAPKIDYAKVKQMTWGQE